MLVTGPLNWPIPDYLAQTVCVTGSTTTGEKLTEANMREAFAASDEILGLDAVSLQLVYAYACWLDGQ